MDNSSAIVLQTAEIIDYLPAPMRGNDELIQAIVEELQQGIEPYKVRVAAIEAAHRLLEQKVDTGFLLVNKELTDIKHIAELDRVHAQYAKQSALEAKQAADQALAKIHEVATVAAVASAKADGATQVAKVGNKSGFMMFDPLTGLTISAIAILVVMMFLSVRVEKTPTQPNLKDALKEFCNEKGNSCNDGNPNRPLPTRGGV